eukprot:12195662-Alexandrium_andersonii.AAC.1
MTKEQAPLERILWRSEARERTASRYSSEDLEESGKYVQATATAPRRTTTCRGAKMDSLICP